MKIVVVRTGGFAGLTRVWSIQVSTEEAEQKWLPLLQNPPPGQPAGPDRFVYDIRVGHFTATLPESCVQGRWRDLVERARQGARNAGADGLDDGPTDAP